MNRWETRHLTTPFERFWIRVDRDAPSGCWEWMGGKKAGGYGQFMYAQGDCRIAHRLAYEWCVGPIPPGLDLDHLCRNRACVNPEHLEPVTRSENLLRSPLVTRRDRTADGRWLAAS